MWCDTSARLKGISKGNILTDNDEGFARMGSITAREQSRPRSKIEGEYHKYKYGGEMRSGSSALGPKRMLENWMVEAGAKWE